jgi:hypothetical protein
VFVLWLCVAVFVNACAYGCVAVCMRACVLVCMCVYVCGCVCECVCVYLRMWLLYMYYGCWPGRVMPLWWCIPVRSDASIGLAIMELDPNKWNRTIESLTVSELDALRGWVRRAAAAWIARARVYVCALMCVRLSVYACARARGCTYASARPRARLSGCLRANACAGPQKQKFEGKYDIVGRLVTKEDKEAKEAAPAAPMTAKDAAASKKDA